MKNPKRNKTLLFISMLTSSWLGMHVIGGQLILQVSPVGLGGEIAYGAQDFPPSGTAGMGVFVLPGGTPYVADPVNLNWTSETIFDSETVVGELLSMHARSTTNGVRFTGWTFTPPTIGNPPSPTNIVPWIKGVSAADATETITATANFAPSGAILVTPSPPDMVNGPAPFSTALYDVIIRNQTRGVDVSSPFSIGGTYRMTDANVGDVIEILAQPKAVVGTNVAFSAFTGQVDTNFVTVATDGSLGTYIFTFDGSAVLIGANFCRSDTDSDGDGVNDYDECFWNLSPGDPGDALLDADQDGLTNIQEINGYTGLRGTFTSNPFNPDSDGDEMGDGWEAHFGLDPMNATGFDGAVANNETLGGVPAGFLELPGGDMEWDAATGLPTVPLNNVLEWQHFVSVNGGTAIDPASFPQTIVDNSTDPFLHDTDGDQLPDGWEIKYGLLASGNAGDQGDNGRNGNPDGDLHYLQSINNDLSGMPTGGFVNRDEYARFPAGRGSTDPGDADTDEDGLPDGWENDMSLGSGFPAPDPLDATGDHGPAGNPDGDFTYVLPSGRCGNEPFNNLSEFQTYSSGESGRSGYTTHPNHIDIDGDFLPDHWEILFDYDPWDANSDNAGQTDSFENPDGDFMADEDAIVGNGNEHSFVYFTYGFDPRIGYAAGYDTVYQWTGPKSIQGPFLSANPTNRPYTNLDELIGSGTFAGRFACPSVGSNPRDPDTDGDSMPDGWELYVGLNAVDAADANRDLDLPPDGLSNAQEYANYAVNALIDPTWLNKIWPTDPFNPDTDGDLVLDGAENTFNTGGGGGTFNGHCYDGGGLNPTSCDTDGDHLPDHWEVSFPNTGPFSAATGMEGTVQDASIEDTVPGASRDYDSDGLDNYQEYFTGAVWHWQAGEFIPLHEWFPGGGLSNYDPAYFFDGLPMSWDWHVLSDVEELGPFAAIPFTYIAADPLTGLFNTTDPLLADTDADFLDDFWETYHGLNPLYGFYVLFDESVLGNNPRIPSSVPTPTTDVRIFPFVAGHPTMDVDQDGFNNFEEYYEGTNGVDALINTDPSPHWTTDISYQLAWPNLYYQWNTFPVYFASGGLAFGPSYVYSFESNEGYDTDNDFISDKEEASGNGTPGSTRPNDSEDPVDFVFMRLDGSGAMRTRGFFNVQTNALESFTVEVWVRPSNPKAGHDQVIIERPVLLPAGNTFCPGAVLQLNFRLGIRADGTPFGEYSNSACDPFLLTVKGRKIFEMLPDVWAHLALTYSTIENRMILYKDGEIVDSLPSMVRPANGYIRPYSIGNSPVVIGASDANPSGVIGGSAVVAGPGAGTVFSEPVLSDFYEGHVDEVRVWTNAIPQNVLRSNMPLEFDRARANLESQPNSNGLLFHYNFNDMSDPDHEPIFPNGFDALTGRPNDGSYGFIPWWGSSTLRSTVYNNYLYVPWIENLVAHLPTAPPSNTATLNVRPNPSNPYNWAYETAPSFAGEAHPELDTLTLLAPGTINIHTDLLPLGNAVADADIIGWNVYDPLDTDLDGDGLPDDWENEHGLDPLDPDGFNGPDGDPDGDGLTNLTEFQADTSPFNTDTDGDGIVDQDEDPDGDRLTNQQEQDQFFTRVNDPDTDDDGHADGNEVDASVLLLDRTLTSPVDSRAPLSQKSMILDGAPHQVPHTDQFNGPDRFQVSNWTVEAWIRPDSTNQTGSVIVRNTDTDQRTFDLRLEGNVPKIQFTTQSGQEIEASAFNPIPADLWTHLAASWDNSNRTLTIYVNGLSAQSLASLLIPALGNNPGLTLLGEGLTGNLDELRIFQNVRNPLAIQLGLLTFGGGPVPPSPFVIQVPGRAFIPAPGMDSSIMALNAGTQQHMLVQLKHPLNSVSQAALNAEGIAVLNFVNERTFMVRATREKLSRPEVENHVRWSGMIIGEDKIAQAIRSGLYTAAAKLVQFYPGVSEADALAAVSASGSTVLQSKYMVSGYLVVDAEGAALAALANSNLVSFITPSTPLLNGGALGFVCPGPQVNGVLAMPFVTVGEGWDGPGRGRADLLWYFKNFTSKRPQAEQKTSFQATLDKWGAVAALTFTETGGPGLQQSLDVDFNVIDGPGGVLGTAFFPSPPNPEPVAGDITYDITEDWSNTMMWQAVTLHEAGHALGMGHSADPGSIMFPSGNGSDTLNQDDIDGIQTLYGNAAPVFNDAMLAHYPFDDGSNTSIINPMTGFVLNKGAEDFQNRMNWDFAIENVTTDGLNVIKIVDVIDSDFDGLPDWWEMLFFGDLDEGGFGDDDGDGLFTIYEYLSDTSPRAVNSDNDPNSTSDDREDRDLDGLPNIEEQVFGTDPNLADTDDDGLFDLTEVNNGFDPVSADSPLQRRILLLPGDADSLVEYPMHPRFGIEEFTVEAWVNPSNFALDSVIVQRQVEENVFNYFLRVNTAGVVFGGFTTADHAGSIVVAAPSAIPSNAWSHVQVSFDPDLHRIWLEIDGEEVVRLTTGNLPAIGGVGPMLAVVGPNFAGMIDDVAIWSKYPGVRTYVELEANLSGEENNLVSLLRFDDGTNVGGTSGNPAITFGQIQDFAGLYARDWDRCWQNAATLNGGGFVNGPSPGGAGELAPDPRLAFTLVPPDCAIEPINSILPLSWSIGAFVQATGAAISDTNKFWRCSTDEVFAASSAVRAGGVEDNGSPGGIPYLSDGETAFMETQVVGPGEICFAFRVETEDLVGPDPTQADYLKFLLDGSQMLVGTGMNILGAHGSNDWVEVCFDVSAGRHVLRWEYTKDLVGHVYRDSAWVDDVKFSSASPDTDGDGLPDSYETDTVVGFNTDPNNPDTDGDGMNDGLEVLIGTDPSVAEAQVAISNLIVQPSGQICIDWNAAAGVTYQIQKSFNGGVSWNNAPSGFQQEEMSQRTAAASGTERYCDILSPEIGSPLYRVLIIP